MKYPARIGKECVCVCVCERESVCVCNASVKTPFFHIIQSHQLTCSLSVCVRCSQICCRYFSLYLGKSVAKELSSVRGCGMSPRLNSSIFQWSTVSSSQAEQQTNNIHLILNVHSMVSLMPSSSRLSFRYFFFFGSSTSEVVSLADRALK